MIVSFKSKSTTLIFDGYSTRSYPQDSQRTALRKLRILNAATSLNDLRVPPSNRLELLQGERKGQYSIRINEQWRICFVWTDRNAENVEIVDYY
jgi:proteic killer suppression protein